MQRAACAVHGARFALALGCGPADQQLAAFCLPRLQRIALGRCQAGGCRAGLCDRTKVAGVREVPAQQLVLLHLQAGLLPNPPAALHTIESPDSRFSRAP